MALYYAPGSANITKRYNQTSPITCKMTNLSSFEDPQSNSLFILTYQKSKNLPILIIQIILKHLMPN